MDSDTFVEADVWTVARTEQGNAVLIRPRGSEVAVPIFVGPLEIQAILIGLGGVEVPRPLTHDLFLDALRGLGALLARVEINALRDGTYYARLILVQDSAEKSFDARPSDAIALAVRVHCPLFIAESIVDEAGISIHLVNDSGEPVVSGPLAPSRPESRRERLEEAQERAIDEEDYEEAARIRDKLRELEDETGDSQ